MLFNSDQTEFLFSGFVNLSALGNDIGMINASLILPKIADARCYWVASHRTVSQCVCRSAIFVKENVLKRLKKEGRHTARVGVPRSTKFIGFKLLI